jgi:threonine dehydratase
MYELPQKVPQAELASEITDELKSRLLLARHRLSSHIVPTPLESLRSSRPNQPSCALKLEQCLPTHSFKFRGALNALLAQIDRDPQTRACVTASSGNFGIALSHIGQMLGVGVTVFAPQSTSAKKQKWIRSLGAQFDGSSVDFDEAEARASEFCQATGTVNISAYASFDVIAAAGTILLEIIGQFQSLSRLYVPVGGGGLLAGSALAALMLPVPIDVIGVYPDSSGGLFHAVHGLKWTEPGTSVAEALLGGVETTSPTVEIARSLVREWVPVKEDQIISAARHLVTHQGWLVEPSAAVGLAGFLADGGPSNSATIITGANVEFSRLIALLGDC